ncbi:MAG: esterase/lipase family protein [Eubacterium sp.]
MKRIFSVLLSIVMIVCSCGAAPLAYAKQAEKTSVTPVVVIPGVGSSALYLNPNTAQQSSALTVDGSFVSKVQKTHIVKDTLKVLAGGKVDADIWINKLTDLIEPFTALNFDENGNSVNNIGIDCYWTDSLYNHLDYLETRKTAEPAVCKAICDKIGAENVWLFNYDFRQDVIKDAEQLSEFIDGVKEQSGKDKVTLVGCSLGTSVLSVYIDRYKDRDDIERAIFLDGAMQGVSIAKLFKKDLVLDTDIVMTYMSLMSKNYPSDAINFGAIEKVFNVFDSTVENLVTFLADVTDGQRIDKFYMQVVLPIVGNIPSLWECIPYDDFDECVTQMIMLGWLNPFSDLFAIINEYHAIQGRLESNIKELKDKGVEVAIVCGYGLPTIPITSANTNQSDMLIDTCYASFGATVAKNGETLETATSADSLIDSSTCKFEENTWFLKGVQHMEFVYGTDVNEFVGYICTTDEPLNIEAVEKESGYSQFMSLDSGGKTMSNITAR